MNNTHLLEIDTLTGDEFIVGGEEVLSPEFFIEYGETNFEKQYSQLEFSKEYGTCLCTLYGPATTLTMTIGKELTKDERLELVKARVAQGDFQKEIGGFTGTGVDVIRRWYNTKHPNDPITTMLVNKDSLLEKLTQRNIPIVTSIKANREFTLDQKDGIMDKLDYWKYDSKKYGHCRTIKRLKVFDNYLNTYSYRTLQDLELVRDHGIESRNCYIFIKESLLSGLGKIYLKAMKKKIWNGERAYDNITRFEASRIALKLNPSVKESDVWNEKDGSKEASRYEVTIMLDRASKGRIKPYLEHDMNRLITRGNTIELIYKYL